MTITDCDACQDCARCHAADVAWVWDEAHARNAEIDAQKAAAALPIRPEATHFGIGVSYIGEDGDMIALGHHDPRRVIAALNRHARVHVGLGNISDDPFETLESAMKSLRQTWAQSLLVCQQCAAETVLPDSMATEQAIQEFESQECDEGTSENPGHDVGYDLKAGAFYLGWDASEDAPHAFPVTLWSA